MASVTTEINQTRAVRIAQRRIEGFAQEFGEAHCNLACHAAFPLVLTPDLLYQIWANFVPEAPWTAVAHVLLSRLCRQVGYEIYEMDITDRNLLLRELKVQCGQERFDELGDFLLDYVAQRLTDDDGDTRDLREAQEWTALAYTKPSEAARELAQRLSERVQQEDVGEVLRLASLVEILAEPLVEEGFEPLLVYGKGMKSFIKGDLVNAAKQFNYLPKTQVLGVKFNIPQINLNAIQEDHLTVKSELKLLNSVQQWFEKFCLQHLSKAGWSESQLYRLNLALAEGFNNAVRHAHHALPPETTVEIDVSLWIDRLEIRIWDHGKPFNPDTIREPEPGTLHIGGYGWFLLRRLADRVVYERSMDGRNCLLMVKYSENIST